MDLDRFVQAQKDSYEQALSEIKSGEKRSHWMWYIFPQIAGLGHSAMSQRYSIKSLAEAKAYLGHPVLGPRLIICGEALLNLENRSADGIFGFLDAKKLRSSVTLFAAASPGESIFQQLLSKYFCGEHDPATLHLLESNA
ncbi:MAG TPA: DUF1810 domain-containing protein [Chthoniobacterales bacterium]